MRTAVLALAVSAATTPGLAARQNVDELSWMTGCWRQESGNRVIEEFWTTPGGGGLLGMSRTVSGGRMVAYEFMRIHDEGGLTFTAKPSGQDEASFKVLKRGPRDVVFENLAHDFPQRVIYRRDGDRLVGRIEGTQNGKPGSVDYPMQRVECPR